MLNELYYKDLEVYLLHIQSVDQMNKRPNVKRINR